MSKTAKVATLEYQKPIRLPNGEDTEGRWLLVWKSMPVVNLLPRAPLWVGSVVPVSAARQTSPAPADTPAACPACDANHANTEDHACSLGDNGGWGPADDLRGG